MKQRGRWPLRNRVAIGPEFFDIRTPLAGTCPRQNDVKFLNKAQISADARPYAWLIVDWIGATDNWAESDLRRTGGKREKCCRRFGSDADR